MVPAGETAGDVVVLDGTVTIAGRVTGMSCRSVGRSGHRRVDGDLIAVSDRAFLGSTARVGGDLRYGDERPVLAPGARVAARSARTTGPTRRTGGLGERVRMVAGGVGVDADRRRAARLAGAGRALRRGAAVREHLGADHRMRRRDRDRRTAAGDPGARHARRHPVRRLAPAGRDPGAARCLRDDRLDPGAKVLRNRSTSPWAALLAGSGSCACSPSSRRGCPRRARSHGRRTRSTGRRAVAGRRPGAPAARPEAPAARHSAPAA